MHVSTCYSFCPLPEIEEKFYDMPVDYNDIIKTVNSMNNEEIEYETPK